MRLTFSPDLQQTTKARVVPVPGHILDQASSIHTLLFKATFDSPQSYLRARSDRFRVELWTNLPVHGHAGRSGEWRAVQFMEPEQVQSTSTSASTQSSFSLLADTDGKREENTLYLKLSASLQDHIDARFSYTFRLVHASGHVEWLGRHNNNGTIVVEQGVPGVTLSKEWAARKDGAFGLEVPSMKKPMVYLDKPEQWSGWVWKPSASLPIQFAGTSPCEGKAMVLLPRLSANLGDSLNPLVLVAGESSSLCLSADGKIAVDSTGFAKRATLAVLGHAQDLLTESAALCHGVVLSFDSTAAVVATQQSGAAAPYHVVVLPVFHAWDMQTVSLRKLQLPMASTSEGQGLVLFSPKLRKAKLLNAPLPNDDFLRFGPSGGELLISPVSVVCGNDRTWQITLLTPSKQFTVRTEKTSVPQILPTPPPSPPAREPTFSPLSVGSEVPGTAQPTIPTTRDDSARPVQSPAPSSDNGDHSAHRRRRSLSMMLVRSFPARLVRAYLHAIFNMVFWFWSVFAKAVAVRLIGEGIPQAVTRFLGIALAKTAARSSGTRGGSSAPTNGVEPPDATVGASQRESTRASSAAGGSDSNRGGNETIALATPDGVGAQAHLESDVPVVAPSPLPSSSGLKEHDRSLLAVARAVVSAALPHERSSPPTMLICGPGLIKGLCGTLDGESLPPPSITLLDDGVNLVEFTGLDGEGELTVCFEL
ncbi:hypothetical protein GSI_08266 [Ganoderma sinense ZZ0214-1]|uniref:Uncharacterized protein n=1 Tax=Ganoderma sinense ZZ0214-1 TaxID=1077348 RepID=A0A2G8S770_9APHY|nr:hypothetical protein GSI_08266 [Ganoderma sinense ZZ0214-1]